MKQVIVMRNDLNMRKGKMVAQGAHAAVMAFIDQQESSCVDESVLREWVEGGMKKICVRCDSLEELTGLHDEAKRLSLPAFVIMDAGYTEFKEPTITCMAIGPADETLIDKVTGHLKLL